MNLTIHTNLPISALLSPPGARNKVVALPVLPFFVDEALSASEEAPGVRMVIDQPKMRPPAEEEAEAPETAPEGEEGAAEVPAQ